jgi:hypothetical protein
VRGERSSFSFITTSITAPKEAAINIDASIDVPKELDTRKAKVSPTK